MWGLENPELILQMVLLPNYTLYRDSNYRLHVILICLKMCVLNPCLKGMVVLPYSCKECKGQMCSYALLLSGFSPLLTFSFFLCFFSKNKRDGRLEY